MAGEIFLPLQPKVSATCASLSVLWGLIVGSSRANPAANASDDRQQPSSVAAATGTAFTRVADMSAPDWRIIGRHEGRDYTMLLLIAGLILFFSPHSLAIVAP